MKKVSIRQRIHWSFSVFICLFVINGIVTIHTLNRNNKLSMHVSEVVDPSLKQLETLHNMLTESKMYSTNWVFLRANQDDKNALLKIHNTDYKNIKKQLQELSRHWTIQANRDSLKKLFIQFENLLTVEKKIMASLQKFEDYDDPVLKLEAETIIEDEVIPLTAVATNILLHLTAKEQEVRKREEADLRRTFLQLRLFILVLAFTIIMIGLILSRYLTGVIVKPIKQIRNIVKDLGLGVTNKIEHHNKKDEIGEMVRAVNQLSDKLRYTAEFAQQVGERKFNVHFQPLSEEDTLGKALLLMRDNLKSVDESLNLAQHTAKLGNWEWNVEKDKVFWSDTMYHIFQKDPSSFTPDYAAFIECIPLEDREGIINCIDRCLKDHQPYSHECRIISGDEIKNIFTSGNVALNEEGDVLKLYGTVQDITDRKKIEQQIADSEKRYRQIVETAQEGIWLIDENNYTVFVNKKMCNMLGYTQEEMIGKQNYDFKDESERKNAAEQIRRRRSGISEAHETSYITKSGKKLYAYVSTNPVFEENGAYRGAMAMVTDITQKKIQEELLKQHEANLELKNKELERKNTELEQFAYIASHDLQEPLRTVSSFANQLQKQYKDRLDDIGQKYLFFMEQGTERMKTLITDLLEYSRIGRKKELQPVDCNEILGNVIADLDSAIQESKVEIKTEKLPVVNGYTTEMKQLFQNLIVNAIKFRKKEVAPKICISSQPVNGGWEFSVEDNGIGIDEQHNERIFVIFQRLHTRSEYEGSGIGLSHCKKIVELHGGKIWVKSKPGEGSTFHFTILENTN